MIGGGGSPIPDGNVQPASLDLRLGPVAYSMRASFLPGRETVERRLRDYLVDELDLGSERGVVLQPKRPYLIPLQEELCLPGGVRAKANPKSSTGRLDVFTRVITDHSHRFDEIGAGYHGRLYLEVVPLSFPVRVRAGLTLNQLRLSVGWTELTDVELRDVHAREGLLYRSGQPVDDGALVVSAGLFLSVDLRGDHDRRVGYRSRDHAPLLDMSTRRNPPEPHWEHAQREPRHNRIVLDPQRFYLLMSEEAVSIPPTLAAEMTAYDPTSGELRTHYAGFFDPGFGYDPEGRFHGSRAALEVRAHDVPFMIEHGQRVCKLTFERMLEVPEALYGQGIGSSYQQQDETLGKHFSAPGRPRPGEDRQLTFPVGPEHVGP